MDTDAEKLADILTHNCLASVRASGTRDDPHWACTKCGNRIPVGFPLHMGQWMFERFRNTGEKIGV